MSLSIDVNQVVSSMVQAASGALVDGGQQATNYASHEFQTFIEDIEHIQDLLEKEKVSPEDAQYYVDLQKSSMHSVLLTIKGLGVIAVQNAINAALTVLNTALKTALGSALKFTV